MKLLVKYTIIKHWAGSPSYETGFHVEDVSYQSFNSEFVERLRHRLEQHEIKERDSKKFPTDVTIDNITYIPKE